MKIIILGAGVHGTLYGVRLARGGHDVSLIARGHRAEELRAQGATVRNAFTGALDNIQLPVAESLLPEMSADLCFVFVRREQLDEVIPALRAARAIERIVFMVNHANGSDGLFAALGRKRVVLGFPGVAGSIEDGVDNYVEVVEQRTTIERTAPDIALLLQSAGFRVESIAKVDCWLKRHAVFVTAIAGALYLKQGDTGMLSTDKPLVRSLVLAVREGWSALDRQGVAPSSLLLRAIFCWVSVPLAVYYWSSLFASPRGDYYFARHVRQSAAEMAALAADVHPLIADCRAIHLRRLYGAIDVAAR
jgi:2-dehydropantoate 2-reductase